MTIEIAIRRPAAVNYTVWFGVEGHATQEAESLREFLGGYAQGLLLTEHESGRMSLTLPAVANEPATAEPGDVIVRDESGEVRIHKRATFDALYSPKD